MIQINDFLRRVEHKVDAHGVIEASDIKAFQIDGTDGLFLHLEFRDGELCLSDYFIEKGEDVQIIEVSDLDNQLAEYVALVEKLREDVLNTKGKISLSDEKTIRRTAWAPLTNEFKRKWCGSIAVLERYYRKSSVIQHNPKYRLAIICKEKTDPRMLDELKIMMKGMIPRLDISTTLNAQGIAIHLHP